MIDSKAFRKHAHELVDWMADYLERIEEFPVKSQVKPGEIYNKLPDLPPKKSESISNIFEDFKRIILPGMTHWQSPNYFAYFTANSSYSSVLAEMLTSTLAAQCMVWETSPAAAELEEQVMIWLRDMIGLPGAFEGVIQDTASTATLVALLTSREKMSGYKINDRGFTGNENYRIYCSEEAHSSIDKAVKIAGFGKENLVKIETDQSLSLNPQKLEQALKKDIKSGLAPLCVIAALGTTGTAAIDPVEPIGALCKSYNIWLHIDAAYAGTALLLPEQRKIIQGIENADSFVFNPHKWMFTNFDCTAYFVKDVGALLKTFEILPEYLKTGTRGKVNDYRDWGIQLGRRFRALKLWFVIRDYGVDGLQDTVRKHIQWAAELADKIKTHKSFYLYEPQNFGLVCFRYIPEGVTNKDQLNEMNHKLMNLLNESGKIYLTHTKVKDMITLRMVIGQTNVQRDHVMKAWELITETTKELQ